jgi:hypothetical protein
MKLYAIISSFAHATLLCISRHTYNKVSEVGLKLAVQSCELGMIDRFGFKKYESASHSGLLVAPTYPLGCTACDFMVTEQVFLTSNSKTFNTD